MPEITNLARVHTTVACSGAIKVEAVPEIKKMGFASIINLRESSEPGVNVEAEEAAAKEVGGRRKNAESIRLIEKDLVYP